MATHPKGDVRNRTKLSPKQETVLRALEANKTLAEIAKQMKISVNGVYGHMRRIEQHGVDLSKYRQSTNGSSGNGGRRAAPRNSRRASRNGFSPGVERFLKSLDDEESALKDEASDLESTIESATAKLKLAAEHQTGVQRALQGVRAARQKVARK